VFRLYRANGEAYFHPATDWYVWLRGIGLRQGSDDFGLVLTQQCSRKQLSGCHMRTGIPITADRCLCFDQICMLVDNKLAALYI